MELYVGMGSNTLIKLINGCFAPVACERLQPLSLCIPHGFKTEKKEQKHSKVPFARSFTPWVIWKCVHDHHLKNDWTDLICKPLGWLHGSLLYLFVFVLGGCCSLGLLPSPSIPNYEYTIFSLGLLTCDPFWLHLLSSSFPLFEE